MSRFGDWFDEKYRRADAAHAWWTGKVIDRLCAITGRSNYRLAIWGVAAGGALLVGDDFRYAIQHSWWFNWLGAVGFAPLYAWAGSKEIGHLRELEARAEDDDAIRIPILLVVRHRVLLCTLPLSSALMAATGLGALDVGDAGWLLLGLAGYAALRPNSGGKRISERVRGFVARLATGLSPAPAPG